MPAAKKTPNIAPKSRPVGSRKPKAEPDHPDLPITPTTPITQPSSPTSIGSLANLPTEIQLNAPDFQSLIPSDWWTDSSSVQRQTDSDREQARQSIHEKRNTIATLRDNIALATDIVQAAVDFTKLGKTAISYQVGREAMNTELVKFEQQATRTQLEQAKLANLRQDVTGTQALGQKQAEVWQAKLDNLDNQIKGLRSKSDQYLPPATDR